MKAQFFVLGAFLLCSLFYLGLPPSTPLITTYSDDLTYLYKNIELETPRALNFGLNGSRSTQDLINFTRFVDRVLDERRINFTSLWVVTELTDPDQPSNTDINITVGNFLGYSTTVTLNVSDGSETITNLFVGSNTTNSTLFTSSQVSSSYYLTISFNNIKKKLTLEKNKVNLYFLIRLARGEEILTRESTA